MTVTRKDVMALFFLPSRDLSWSIPVALVSGLLVGLLVDTTGLTRFVQPAVVLMIYLSMVGFTLADVVNLAHGRLVLATVPFNFLYVPVLAYFLGTSFLLDDPQLFAGLAIASVLPTSNMTIAFTMLAGGNVPAAVKLSALSLVLGSLLAPWYLWAMVGRYIPVDIWVTFQTIAVVVFLPLVLGVVTYRLLLRMYTREEYDLKVKPYLASGVTWGLMYITFTVTSTNAGRILSNLQQLLVALGVQALFYTATYSVAVLVGRRFFDRADAVTFVFATVPRSLAVSMGLAATAFGPNAALMIAVAFLLQGQSGSWFIKLNHSRHLFPAGRACSPRGVPGGPGQ